MRYEPGSLLWDIEGEGARAWQAGCGWWTCPYWGQRTRPAWLSGYRRAAVEFADHAAVRFT